MKSSFIYTSLFSLIIVQCSLFGQIPLEGLVASYPFNGNALDESGNGHNGVVFGATLTEDRCNNLNSAYRFDGTNDNILVYNFPMPARELTISLWAKTEVIKKQMVFKQLTEDVNRVAASIHYYTTPNTIVYPDSINTYWDYGNTYEGSIYSCLNKDSLNKWEHYVFQVSNKNKFMKVFLNNELAIYDNIAIPLKDSIFTLAIGGSEYYNIGLFYQGSVDDINIYDRVLTNDEIRQLYVTNCTEILINGAINVCQGDKNIIYNVISDTELTNYEWSYSGTGINIEGSSDSVSIDFSDDATSGTLSVTVSGDSFNQTLEMTVNVLRKPEPPGIISGNTHVCPDQDGYIYSVPWNNMATEYQWSYSGTGAIISGNSNPVSLGFALNATPGILSVAVQNICGKSEASELLINIDSLPTATGDIIGENAVCAKHSYIYNVKPVSNVQNYFWQYSENGADIINNSDTAVIYFSEAISGILTVSGENSCGRGPQSAFSIYVDPCDINIPNSFSPNDDGINDVFYIRNLPENTRIMIFNRLGKELYKSDNYQNNWDGTDYKGNNLESDTYWYIIIVPGIKDEFSGFVYIKR